MEEIIRSIYQEHGRIDAVIHGAGIIEDKLLMDKTAESFHRGFRHEGRQHVAAQPPFEAGVFEAPRVLRLPVAGRMGNRGQC